MRRKGERKGNSDSGYFSLSLSMLVEEISDVRKEYWERMTRTIRKKDIDKVNYSIVKEI